MTQNPSENADRYALRGVSSGKESIHRVVDAMDRGLFPGAFCKIGPDVLTGDPEKCVVIHSDGSGTKSILAYLHFRETGDASAFAKTAQDSVVMNLDDLLCIGAVDGILLSSTINRNARAIPEAALAALIHGTETFLAAMRALGVGIHSGGGETADVGDLTPTTTVDSCAVAVLPRSAVVDNSRIVPGLSIVGLASDGQASYEEAENSGIGSNGLTSARHDLLAPYYRDKYPETCDKGTSVDLLYCGRYRMEDPLPGSALSVGDALMSPTRSYAPIIREILMKHRSAIRGMVHCSGGGQTKCKRFGTGVLHLKENLFPAPPIFRAIQEASGTADEEMYRVYNMGHRMEVFCEPDAAEDLIALSRSFGVDARIIGRTLPSERSNSANHVRIRSASGEFNYG